MTDALAPQDIARRNFDVARRGYEQQEVRGFLHEVSALVERLQRAEAELRERAERAEARLGEAAAPDEAMLLEVLGEETTRVLTSAREAATEIRSKAEASAERIIAEATAEAAEMRANAVRDADALMATAKADSDAILEEARTELDRRRAEAQEATARIREEGQAQAEALRAEGQAELARAREEAEAALEAARQQGREMVAEAQAVRERVLRDLAVRRKRSRQQVEKLNAGRERLLQAYEVVRRTIDEATNELTVSLVDARIAADAAARRVEEEPEATLEQLDAEVAAAGLVDLPIADIDHQDDHDDDHDEGSGPLSGEVPAVATAAVSTDDAPASSTTGPAVPSEPEAARVTAMDDRRGRKGRRKKGFEGLPAGELSVVAPPGPDEGVRVITEPAAPEEDAVVASEADARAQDEAAGAEPAVAATGEAAAVADDDGLLADAPGEDAEPGEPSDGGESPRGAEHPRAEDVFARLRAETDAAPAAAPADDALAQEPASESEPEPTSESDSEPAGDAEPEQPAPAGEALPFAARAAALAPIDKELGRRLKRALADEQNEVLDLLRRAKPKGVDDLLPDADAHAARWADAAADALTEARAAGAEWSGGAPSSSADLADELARGLTGPLRERIDRSFTASDGNVDEIADRVRALYREWKGQRLREATEHFVAAAYARGVFDGISSDKTVRWVVDPSAGPCPDCDDNVLGGAIAKGEEFPTGNACAPAHPGCHCLVLPAEG
jgi:cell division septum initiation protein DivIVA